MQTDQDLASQCLHGHEGAWEILVRRYHRKVWNVAYHFTGRSAEADELTQEIFLHILGALKRFDPASSMSAWIGRVARNCAIDHYRRRRQEISHTAHVDDQDQLLRMEKDSSRAASPDYHLEQKELAAWIRSALDRLPKELGQAVLLRDLQEMSYEEMVELLGIPLGTVKSRLNRGRLELARQLKRRRASWADHREGGQP